MPRSSSSRAAAASALALAAATFLSFSLSPSSSYVAATYTAKELQGEGAIEVQAVQDILNNNLGPTKAEQKNATIQKSDFLPDLPAYGLPGPCGVSPNVIDTKITVKCPDFDEFKKALGWKNITLRVTMTLPGKAANGRAAPWPVIFIFAGFSVSSVCFLCNSTRRGAWSCLRADSDAEGGRNALAKGGENGEPSFQFLLFSVSTFIHWTRRKREFFLFLLSQSRGVIVVVVALNLALSTSLSQHNAHTTKKNTLSLKKKKKKKLPSWGYTRYANHLASWGYATVQYDPDPYWLTIMPRGVETELFVNPVIEWAVGAGAAAANTQLDVRRMGVTGHSLGGKVSVLALGYSKTGSRHAGPTNISAAFLLDAVDIRIVTHEAPYFYSNMGETFANITVPIGAMGMPLRDKCTIPGHSWDVVYPSARKGSWMFLVYHSSHVVWMAAADDARDRIVFDYATFMCGGIGDNSKEATIKYTLAAMTAWFDGGAVGDPGKAAGGVGDPNTPALQQQFLSWAESPAQEKWVWFGIKNSSRFDTT